MHVTLKTVYPPAGTFVAETQDILDQWETWIKEAKQVNRRLKRCNTIVVEEKKIKRTVKADESIVVQDDKTNEIVLMVI